MAAEPKDLSAEDLADILLSIDPPDESFSNLDQTPDTIPIPNLPAQLAALGLDDAFTQLHPDAPVQTLISEISLLVWIIHATIGAIGSHLRHLADFFAAKDLSQGAKDQKLAAAIKSAQGYLRLTLSENSTTHPFALGLFRGFTAPNASTPVQSACARDLQKRLREWSWPSTAADEPGPLPSDELAAYPRAVHALVSPHTALVLDFAGHAASQMAYALYLALTHKRRAFSIGSMHHLIRATEAAQAEPTKEVLIQRLEAIQTRHGECPARADAHGGIYNCWRVRALAARLALLLRIALSSLLTALQTADLPDRLEAVPLPELDLTDLRERLSAFLTTCGWIQQYPGMPEPELDYADSVLDAPPDSPKRSRSDGIKFLSRERGYTASSYHMPCVNSALQYEWEEWFDRLHSLLNTFDLKHSDIIFGVTSHLKSTHPVMVGWTNKSDSITTGGRAVTLDDFCAHARERLFSENAIRKHAWYSMQVLCKGLAANHEDCNDVVTAIQELMRRIFPSHPTSEQAPCTIREACETIWSMLIAVNTELLRQEQVTWFHRAWSRYTWDSAGTFEQYLDPVVHNELTPAKSHQLYLDFVAHVCKQLERAHRQFHATHKLTSALDPLTGGPAKPASVMLFSAEQENMPPGYTGPANASAGVNFDSVMLASAAQRRKLDALWAANPKARRTALTADLPAARPLPPGLPLAPPANVAPPAQPQGNNQGNNAGAPFAPIGAGRGGRGGRGARGGRGGRNQGRNQNAGRGANDRQATEWRTVNGQQLEYFTYDGKRKWTSPEFYQLEANAPVRARFSSLAHKLGLQRTHNSCLAFIAVKKCPLCTGDMHRKTEQCEVYAMGFTEEVQEIMHNRQVWRQHCRQFNTIPEAVAGWPHAQLPPYKEYPNPPDPEQVRVPDPSACSPRKSAPAPQITEAIRKQPDVPTA